MTPKLIREQLLDITTGLWVFSIGDKAIINSVPQTTTL